MSTLKFSLTKSEVERFAMVALDDNPLHSDSVYASQTMFGRNIAHGILVVLKAIAAEKLAADETISQLSAQFLKPIYCDQTYTLSSSREDRRVTMSVTSSSIECLKLSFVTAESDGVSDTEGWAGKWHSKALKKRSYSLDHAALAEFCDALGVGQSLTRSQIQFLMFSSYYVGKINPGRQALYCELNVEFCRPTSKAASLEILDESLDQRFALHTITCECEAGGVRSASMRAFERPAPVATDPAVVKEVVDSLPALPFRRVLVAGGARGIGSALSLAFALSGAQVTVCHRSQSDNLSVLQSASGNIQTVRLDLNENIEIIREALLPASAGKYDLLLLCASPAIQKARFDEQGSRQTISQTGEYIKPTLNILEAVLGELEENASIAHISSEFVSQPKAGFATYTASKSFIEGLMDTLQMEWPKLNFVNCRLPTVLTDQTNSNIGSKSLPRAESILPVIWRALQ